jgi:hypothetical protein
MTETEPTATTKREKHYFKAMDLSPESVKELQKLSGQKEAWISHSVLRLLRKSLVEGYHFACDSYSINKQQRVLVLRPWAVRVLFRRSEGRLRSTITDAESGSN